MNKQMKLAKENGLLRNLLRKLVRTSETVCREFGVIDEDGTFSKDMEWVNLRSAISNAQNKGNLAK